MALSLPLRTRLAFALLFSTSVPLAGCGPTEERAADKPAPAATTDARTFEPLEPEALDETAVAQRDRGTAARDALFASLLQRLIAVISSSGPETAIAVCGELVPELGAKVRNEHDLKIGRTSFRLRNPSNVPPAWAQAWVDERVEEPRYARADDGTLAMLLPIRLKQECLMCHGAVDAMDPKVVAAIDRKYPDDAATGFAEGDLRGWFWIEVPPAK